MSEKQSIVDQVIAMSAGIEEFDLEYRKAVKFLKEKYKSKSPSYDHFINQISNLFNERYSSFENSCSVESFQAKVDEELSKTRNSSSEGKLRERSPASKAKFKLHRIYAIGRFNKTFQDSRVKALGKYFDEFKVDLKPLNLYYPPNVISGAQSYISVVIALNNWDEVAKIVENSDDKSPFYSKEAEERIKKEVEEIIASINENDLNQYNIIYDQYKKYVSDNASPKKK